MLSSCFGRSETDPQNEPLRPSQDESQESESLDSRQQSLKKKLHTYLMVRALSRGYFPTTEQSIALLQNFLASDSFAENNRNLTSEGRKFVKLSRKLVLAIIELLKDKNGEDNIQEFLWTARRARMDADPRGLLSAGANTADASASLNSLSSMTSLLFSNSDFNKLFTDVTTIFRQVVSSTASTTTEYAGKVASHIKPSDAALDAIEASSARPDDEVQKEQVDLIGDVGATVGDAVKDITNDAVAAWDETITPERVSALKGRVKQTIISLRKNSDYTSSVSTVSILLKNYLTSYARALPDAASKISDEAKPNDSLNKAGTQLWSIVSSFGEEGQWNGLQESVDKLMQHKDAGPELEEMTSLLADAVNRLLTDPNYLFEEEDDESNASFSKVKEKFTNMDGPQAVKDDLQIVLGQMMQVWQSVQADAYFKQIQSPLLGIGELAFPSSKDEMFSQGLFTDIAQIFISTIQYIPIPRITLYSPDIDLLLEPVILEPGDTVNDSSFLPYRVGVISTNNVDVIKGPQSTSTNLSSTAQITIQGLTVKAEDVGYVMDLHKNWLLRLTDSGIASFRLDERGLDVILDLEFSRSSVDQMVLLKDVKVNLHKVDFTLRQSKFNVIAWMFKKVIKGVVRKLLEKSIRDNLEKGLRTANRELIYARERLRATRIANPADLSTFVKAVMARWTGPSGSPSPTTGAFDDVHAPGSLTGLFQSEGVEADDRLAEADDGGWKNSCFDAV